MGFRHKVRQGEYLSKIAHQNGFADWRTIYDHAENAAFRELRPDPNLIHPGDELFIPDRADKQVECATGKMHAFKVRLGTNSLHVTLKDSHGTPIRNTPYELTIGSRLIKGSTDGDGGLHHENLPPDVPQATLAIVGLTLTLKVGHLDPLGKTATDGVSGVQGRLRNLGYFNGPIDGVLTDLTREAIRHFKMANDLGEDGELSAAVKDKLREEYGC